MIDVSKHGFEVAGRAPKVEVGSLDIQDSIDIVRFFESFGFTSQKRNQAISVTGIGGLIASFVPDSDLPGSDVFVYVSFKDAPDLYTEFEFKLSKSKDFSTRIHEDYNKARVVMSKVKQHYDDCVAIFNNGLNVGGLKFNFVDGAFVSSIPSLVDIKARIFIDSISSCISFASKLSDDEVELVVEHEVQKMGIFKSLQSLESGIGFNRFKKYRQRIMEDNEKISKFINGTAGMQ